MLYARPAWKLAARRLQSGMRQGSSVQWFAPHVGRRIYRLCTEMTTTGPVQLGNATKGAITGRGNMSASWNEGYLSSDLTLTVPIKVDCNKLISESSGGGTISNMATNVLDMVGEKEHALASQIESSVKEQVGNQLGSACAGMAAELSSCSVRRG